MTRSAESKYQLLLEVITSYHYPAVAYSGGVDSALLLEACIDRFGAAGVTALLADSELQVPGYLQTVAADARKRYGPDLGIRIVRLELLDDPLIAINSEQRCYRCKTLLYQRLLTETRTSGNDVLFDGTNREDLLDDRPGLRALRELGVVTPLVEAGLRKGDIRRLAKAIALPQAELPANSCLATRFRYRTALDSALLAEVAILEGFLHQLGFTGCRVRPDKSTVMVICSEKDFELILRHDLRVRIVDFFRSRGYASIGLDLGGRSIK